MTGAGLEQAASSPIEMIREINRRSWEEGFVIAGNRFCRMIITNQTQKIERIPDGID
jgi:hypothetical protein